jgi:ABC-type multidrug transport system fused ATPase/permease subunit
MRRNTLYMKIKKIIYKSKYHLLFSVLPIVLIVGCFKVGVHILDWEVIPKEMNSFFPSILAGIIFLLGFLLAGVISDYKESEKIPNELAASLFALWQEADYVRLVSNSKNAKNLMNNIKNFIPSLKSDYFILQNENLQKLLDSFSFDVIEMGKEGVPPNYIIRMKTEIAAIKKTINRISIIKNTDFIPSVFISIKTIAIVFLIVYCLLNIDPWWVGLILVSIFAFIIFSILFLIKDMEDPFEYDESFIIKSDEVSLEVLDNLQKEFINK